jgi:hypothetical protein
MTYLSSCPLFGFGSCVGAKKICSAATGCNCLQLVQILPKETDVEQAMRFSFVCGTSFSEHGVFMSSTVLLTLHQLYNFRSAKDQSLVFH